MIWSAIYELNRPYDHALANKQMKTKPRPKYIYLCIDLLMHRGLKPREQNPRIYNQES